MKPSSVILRAFAALVASFIIQAVGGILIPIKTAPAPHFMAWNILSLILTTAALTVLAVRTDWRGWRLGASVALIPLVLFAVNLLEGKVFLTNTNLPWGRIFLFNLLSSALMIPVWTGLFGGESSVAEHFHPIRSKSRGERLWKFVVSDFTYLFLYFAAGSIIFPFVRDFYATQHLPSLGTIVALQLMIRGPVFVLLCLLMTRMLGLTRLTGALAVGALFTVLSGIAPLLMPNPVFPDAVRWVHFCEVVSENFVFGAIVAWLWGEPVRSRITEQVQAAA